MALEHQSFVHSGFRCLHVHGVGIGRAQGSFGELLQGALPGVDNNFLVTLPIQRHSWAVFEVDPRSRELTVSPIEKWKSLRMVRQVLAHFDSNFGGKLVIDSTLPEGKGMSSSSADLVATAFAVANALNQCLPTHVVLKFLRSIEPTDGVMYPGSVVFFHRKVQLGWRLAGLPDLHIIAVDEGGQIDTIAYNIKHKSIGDDETAIYSDLLQRTIRAFELRDLDELGLIATRSAVMNQRRNPKRLLDEVLRIARSCRALGVVATHSGPCLGILFRNDGSDTTSARCEAAAALKSLGSEVTHLQTMHYPRELAAWRRPPRN
ncbi:GHMP family kinase ATP-binding protein [Bradyrhizobium diazoefficiens]